MKQGILPSFVTSGKSLNLSGPWYNWEGDLHDLSLQVLTSFYVWFAKAFHGTGFDLFSIIVTLAVAHCPYGAPSCEEPLSLTRRKQARATCLGVRMVEAQATCESDSKGRKRMGCFMNVSLVIIIATLVC